MLDDRSIRLVRNNAEWCDAVCCAQGKVSSMRTCGLNRHPVPHFYPNAAMLAEPNQRQLDLIDELLAAPLLPGWAVKDSFCMLDLASRGSVCCSWRSGFICRCPGLGTSPLRERRCDGRLCGA